MQQSAAPNGLEDGMEVKKLAPGTSAPMDGDCINIDTVADGRVRLTGTALCGGDSVALTGMHFDSAEAAEEQGLAWAESQGVTTLYVTFDAPINERD